MASNNSSILTFPSKNPPLGLIAAARLAGIPVELQADDKLAKDAPSTLTVAEE